jgi:maleylpyruvate isomerase
VGDPGSAPVRDLVRVAEAQARFNTLIETFGDAVVRRPSLLPGWSVAHVLTHVARNADSHVRRAEAAIAGTSVDQYEGGYAGRSKEIEAGATQAAAALIDDVVTSGQRTLTAWAEVPERAWAATSRDVGGTERALASLPSRRWQELEVHLVDLDAGPTHQDWPDDFVAVFLPPLRASLERRLPPGEPAPGGLDRRDELAWLYGRLRRDDLPTLAPWG